MESHQVDSIYHEKYDVKLVFLYNRFTTLIMMATSLGGHIAYCIWTSVRRVRGAFLLYEKG